MNPPRLPPRPASRRPAQPDRTGPTAAAPPRRRKPGPKARPRRKLRWGRWLLALALAPLVWVLAYAVLPIPGTWLMVERAFAGDDVRREMAGIEQISPHLVRAVIASEDAKFCAHDGFDMDAIQRALAANERGRRLRGGSTISQQTAKNVFLWPERSWLRKGLEAGFTVLIETFWSKRRIMEAYLNVAEFGPGLFGAEAAARGHFGKSARDLGPAEAARLAAILPSPRKWSPTRPGRHVARRAAAIQKGAGDVRARGLDACVLGGREGRR